MRARLVTLTLALFAGWVSCAGDGATPPPAAPVADPSAAPAVNEAGLPGAGEGVLYAIGASLGDQVKPYALDAEEAEEMARGMVDQATGRPYAGPRSEELSNNVALWHERRLQEVARREELAGAPALERALREPGARKTESGMIVNVLDPGKGKSPGIFDVVTVAYHGTLRDGTVFDTSRDKKPLVAQLGTTNRCWQEALGSVGAGARLHLACPPSLGYGWGGWPGLLPGGAVLIYELELISVEPKAPPPNWVPPPNWNG
jgi:FKBP-type peptidyl-prolyl cis-trans isomerase